jgi:hypothetical protein
MKGGENTVYIKKVLGNEDEYIYPIIKNIFPNKNIEFAASRDSYDLTIYSHNDFIPENSSLPYIFTCGERWDKIVQKQTFTDPKCIANILTTQQVQNVNNYYYIPFFLNVGPIIYNSSPFVRKYDSSNRSKLAAYLATHSPEHREKFFNALKALDNTVDGLGSANNTLQTDIPSRTNWWDSPEIFKDYKFGFAMENLEEDGYITEKIMNVYRGGAIPLYWGTSKVKEIFHPDSFIYLNDYPSLEDAAKDVVAASQDKERMNKMFNAPIFQENNNFSKYYDTPSPQWVIDIANEIKSRLTQKGGEDKKNIDCNISGGKKRIKHKVNRKKIIGGQQKNKIILTLMGGLANRIIQILAGIGFSEKWNIDLFINSEIMYDNNHIKKDKSIEEIKELFPQIPWIESFNKNIETIYDPEEFIYHNIKNPNKDVILHGIFQSEKYFPQNKYNINLKEPNNNIIKNIDKTNLYFIHFRFGDYNNSPRHKLNLIKYYQYCIKEILKNNKNITFIILSDNISDAKNYISTNLNDVLTNVNLIYDENNSRLDTLYFMSKCYGAICPNSTFSWIGAYLIENKGPIYFPKPWLSDHDINKDYDIYSPWMIQININNI